MADQKKYDLVTGRRLIDAERFTMKVYEIDSHYNYVSHAIQVPETQRGYWSVQRNQLKQEATRFLKDPSAKGQAQLSELLDSEENAMRARMPTHLQLLRRQCTVSLHSLIEAYLAHVVEVYIEYFPEILKRSEKKLNLPDVIDHRDDIVSFLVPSELSYFDYLGLPRKYTYVRKELRLDPDTWGKGESAKTLNSLNEMRDEIVHGSSEPEIDDPWMRNQLNEAAGFVFRVAVTSQSLKGVQFKFFEDSADIVKYPDEPNLDG